MDAFGTHSLSYRFSAMHIPRHSAINHVVRRGLSAAGIRPCSNTLASSKLIRVALAAGADAAEVRKIAKYAELGRRFILQAVVVETSGVIGKSTIQLLKDLVRRLAVRFQD